MSFNSVLKNVAACSFLYIMCVFVRTGFTHSYVAYSLETAREMITNRQMNPEVRTFGGISRMIGFVYDTANDDIVLLGEKGTAGRTVTLNDFVVSLRALLIKNEWPLVSIDKTPRSAETRKQTVRFEGGIENTRFGKDLLSADITLKKLALGYLAGKIWGIESYVDLMADAVVSKGVKDVSNDSKFWFFPLGHSFSLNDNVFVIQRLNVGLKGQLLTCHDSAADGTGPREATDAVGNEFVNQLNGNFCDIANYYPEILRINTLYDLIGISQGIKNMKLDSKVRFWLHDYTVEQENTPRETDLLARDTVLGPSNARQHMIIDGGIALRSYQERIAEDGDLLALRDLVLLCRRSKKTLLWNVPIGDWTPSIRCTDAAPRDQDEPESSTSIGFGLSSTVSPVSGSSLTMPTKYNRDYVSEIIRPKFTDITANRLDISFRSPNVGGVMLQNVATIRGAGGVDLAGGGFSLVVDGERAQIDPHTFRNFVTALWAMYYSDEDPGISIDPIAPSSKKHMVRYIGRVVNSDLGRVMREADYLMKKWAVGTERPDIPGFRNPDDCSSTRGGLDYIGASSRFWFVPENMTFKRGGDMLLFDSGRMTVKTEYLFQNKRTRADPCNQAFADFFTDHYTEIAAKYPVYRELFDYAKLVALCKYLRDSRIPLFWFLLANKDLVLTEDAPGTVDELAKGSDYWKNIFIKGGVEMKSSGAYVYDAEAVRAISTALASMPSGSPKTGAANGTADASVKKAEPFSFDFGTKSYSVLPQHSLTSGRDREGIRYQTDIALRGGGMPGLELVRYFDPARPDGGEFGNGWRLLVPYRVVTIDTAKREFLNVRVPVRMAVENLLHGGREPLTFSTDRYSIAGWVPDNLSGSQVVGLFLISDATFRLQDKIGNQFWFDRSGVCTDMILSDNHHVKIAYFGAEKVENIDGKPLRLQSGGPDTVMYQSVILPRIMTVTNLVSNHSERFVFNSYNNMIGYTPENVGQCPYTFLALMSDGSFRLVDGDGNEVDFDGSGEYRFLIASGKQPLPRSLSLDNQVITFDYAVDGSGKLRIARANLLQEKPGKDEKPSSPKYIVRYEYDDLGRLCRAEGSDTRTGNADAQEGCRVALK